jgi:hypothetical protein
VVVIYVFQRTKTGDQRIQIPKFPRFLAKIFLSSAVEKIQTRGKPIGGAATKPTSQLKLNVGFLSNALV